MLLIDLIVCVCVCFKDVWISLVHGCDANCTRSLSYVGNMCHTCANLFDLMFECW